MIDSKAHWSHIYQTKKVTEVSWYQPRPDISLELIHESRITASGRIIDVGAGASTLVDYLLDDGYSDITLLDISSEALQTVHSRLGSRAYGVSFIEADINNISLPSHAFDIWHDRAVFHFLTDVSLRQKYIHMARRIVKPGGYIIVATFAPDGPAQCSGLDVVRYDAESLHQVFGEGFKYITSRTEAHHTPRNTEQKFVYCCCQAR